MKISKVKPWILMGFTAMAQLLSYGDSAFAEDYGTAHLRSAEALRQISSSRGAVMKAIADNNLPELIRLEKQTEQHARDARNEMDWAFIAGAWKPGEIKREGAEVIGRIEAVQQLNFISLAILTGYKNFTDKTPASVADATARMFAQADALLTKVESLNSSAERVALKAQ